MHAKNADALHDNFVSFLHYYNDVHVKVLVPIADFRIASTGRIEEIKSQGGH